MQRIGWVILGSTLILAGCSPLPPTQHGPVDLKGGKAHVVTTTTMIADLVRQVGGEHVKVESLMPPGVDPHGYKSSADDSRKMREAHLVVYNGLHLEGKMSDLFEDMGKYVRVRAVASALHATELRQADADYEGTHDPHIWFDVSLWAKTIAVVRDALIEIDPAHADAYRANAAAYHKTLTDLHEEVKRDLAVVPKDRRVLITAHDAFYYFGRAYDFEVRGLQGVSTNAEPSAGDVKDLAKFIVDRRVTAIFGESSVPDRGILAVQGAVRKESSRRNAAFEVKYFGEKLYSDSLGDADGPAGTYVGMVRHNVRTIAEALK